MDVYGGRTETLGAPACRCTPAPERQISRYVFECACCDMYQSPQRSLEQRLQTGVSQREPCQTKNAPPKPVDPPRDGSLFLQSLVVFLLRSLTRWLRDTAAERTVSQDSALCCCSPRFFLLSGNGVSHALASLTSFLFKKGVQNPAPYSKGPLRGVRFLVRVSRGCSLAAPSAT